MPEQSRIVTAYFKTVKNLYGPEISFEVIHSTVKSCWFLITGWWATVTHTHTKQSF